MKLVFCCLWHLTFAWGAVQGDEMADGFYYISKDESAPKVATQNGETLKVGNPLHADIHHLNLWSQDNRNERFSLKISYAVKSVPPKTTNDLLGTKPYDELLLLVKGTAYSISSFGRGGGGGGSSGGGGGGSYGGKKVVSHAFNSLSFQIRGQEKANEVAAYFGIQPKCRKHPGHRFNVSFITPKKEFLIGEKIWVTLRVENVSEAPVAFFHASNAPSVGRDDDFTFCARYMGKQIADLQRVDSRSTFFNKKRILEPGEVFEKKVKLNDWFTMTEPGTYHVLGSYRMIFCDPRNEGKTMNLPYEMMWEDYLTAKFVFEVKKG